MYLFIRIQCCARSIHFIQRFIPGCQDTSNKIALVSETLAILMSLILSQC